MGTAAAGGLYVQGNAGVIRTLDQRKVREAIEQSPRTRCGGQRRIGAQP